MKKIIFFFILLSPLICIAQNASIRGSIYNNSHRKLEAVTVILKNSLEGALTDQNGTFTFFNLEAGNYIVSISHLGYKSKNIAVTLKTDQSLVLDPITLYEGNEILNEVVVSGKRRNKFSRKQTAYVAKLPLKDIENTQVYSTITTELIESQLVTNFDDALKNATGVEQLWSSTGRSGDGAGYYSLRGFSVQPQLVNGLPGLTNGTINAANVERIEVIKGPSATLFGNAVSSYGGLINVVTKKPYVGTGGQFSYTAGSYGLNQLLADYNTSLDASKSLFFRVNTAYTTQQSFQDAGFRKSFFIAPSISYKVNNRLSFSFYGEITQAEQTNPTFLFLNRSAPTESANLAQLNYNNKLSFTSNELTLENPTQNYRLEMDYKLSDSWKSQTLVSTSNSSTKGYYSYLFEYGILGNDTFSRFISKQNANTQTADIQQNFIGDFEVATLRNRIVVGLDYFSATETSQNSGYAFYGNVTPEGGSNGDNPFTPDIVEADLYPLSTAGVDNVLASQAVGNIKSSYGIYSLYASNVLNITNKFSAMFGLRIDHFDNEGDVKSSEDNFEQTAFSPKLGLLYQPIEDELSLFINYQNGFNNVAPQLVGNPDEGPQRLETFKPEQANQLEIGIKTNLLTNRINTTLSYYDIKVKDRVIVDPSSPFNRIQGGEIESQGLEFELNANPINGLNIRAGYSYNESKTTKTDDPLILNKRPLEAGPKTLYNLWANYAFQTGTLAGFGAGIGMNGASKRFVKNYTTTGNFTLPSYTVANAALFYEAAAYRISLKLNNVFNKEYYKGWSTINPQMPRAVLANVSYKF
ncbi:TonB-dependent receptor [Dokdonia sp. Hel_I_53]|uniref:TonB-dependent receptor n=1 Tax=Dokdonia sp. Hel_I_53 TaxID=1566287 RepID=UPI00119C30FF|nr:TonB-dependent receptor [Dokdonia sp. Hel_I_53]TVZ53180.1 iron complex outermembrane receptor protein [Dokdonia sp. Hel_I_53]